MRSFPYGIPVGDAVIEVLDENRFNILTEFVDYKGYYVPDTQDLLPVMQALQNPDWDEDSINTAVAALEAREAALQAQEWQTMPGTLGGDQFPAQPA